MRKPTVETRMPVVRLRKSDLLAFPVWEYAIGEEGAEGQDETWVRPVATQAVPMNQYSQLVAADFTTSSGRTCSGFMILTTVARKVEITPGALIGDGRYLPLPSVPVSEARKRRITWDLELRDAILEAFGRRGDGVFPLHYGLRVRVGRESSLRSGEVA